jgi:hypothetical protein
MSIERDQLDFEEGTVRAREYAEQLARCRAELKPALAELDADGGTDLDIEEIIEKGREILASEGVVDSGCLTVSRPK